MMRWSTVFWGVLAIFAGIGLFIVKYEVRDLESRLAEVNRELVREQETIHVLRAEWSYLARPDRVKPLARKLLGLQPLRAGQTITINQLLAKLDADALARQSLANLASERSNAAPLRQKVRLRKSR